MAVVSVGGCRKGGGHGRRRHWCQSAAESPNAAFTVLVLLIFLFRICLETVTQARKPHECARVMMAWHLACGALELCGRPT